MKKFVFCFAILFTMFCFFPVSTAKAESEKVYYAKVPTSGVNFCAQPNEASALFEVPFSYFVKIDGMQNDFFKVTYKGLEGYVKKDKVNLVDGQPNKPFDNTSFNVYLSFSLYQSTNQSMEIATLSPSTTLTYYGKKAGQQLKVGVSDWYYSSTVLDGQTKFGYVYSDHTSAPIQVEENYEIFPIVSEDVLFPNTASQAFSGLSTGTKIILIVAISVPSLLILYFLIKPSRIMQNAKTRKRTKPQAKRIRHGDYFEFDESEL